MRAVLDPNVLISAVLSRNGAPAQLVRAWLDGAFDLIVSDLLLAELERALSYRKLRTRVTPPEAARFVEFLRHEARMHDDPHNTPRIRSHDPRDDYLIVLAEDARAVLVSGDRHLLELGERLPVLSPAGFLAELAARG